MWTQRLLSPGPVWQCGLGTSGQGLGSTSSCGWALRAHLRTDRDDPMWPPGPLEEPAPRGVTLVSRCLSRGYDESTESPSGFLIFPTAVITSPFRRQTPPVLRRDPSHGLTLDRAPLAVNSKTDQGSRAGLGTAWSLCPPISPFKKEHSRPSISSVHPFSPPYTLMVPHTTGLLL